ncbi:MAG: hypothetical protein AAFU73_23115 [Planctomycetota bacterium]
MSVIYAVGIGALCFFASYLIRWSLIVIGGARRTEEASNASPPRAIWACWFVIRNGEDVDLDDGVTVEVRVRQNACSLLTQLQVQVGSSSKIESNQFVRDEDDSASPPRLRFRGARLPALDTWSFWFLTDADPSNVIVEVSWGRTRSFLDSWSPSPRVRKTLTELGSSSGPVKKPGIRVVVSAAVMAAIVYWTTAIGTSAESWHATGKNLYFDLVFLACLCAATLLFLTIGRRMVPPLLRSHPIGGLSDVPMDEVWPPPQRSRSEGEPGPLDGFIGF